MQMAVFIGTEVEIGASTSHHIRIMSYLFLG